MSEMGRPEFTDEQYKSWLEDIRPFLENANSLRYAIDQAGLTRHKNVLYRKYGLNDWFRDKVDEYRQKPGELVNDTFVTLVRTISDKAKRKELLTTEEINVLKFFAEKSRSSQPWFVNRQEVAEAAPVDDLLIELDQADKGYDAVADEAAKQVVATNPPVQNPEQAGPVSDVQPAANPVTPPSGS